ncbi:hypothetical protein CN268_09780 [Bacillus anthracis]|nr:hypothetical protein [Bacillus cereus]PES21239.1 hypothetical protein CN488_18795 [Bacillus anthracis]PEY19200.1 hypothetical protein CN340_26800 [Bacillus anthracis]PFB63245.1 hypothetical protein CN268_09780 [Bacillus anthracis]PGR18022.1 hypothetical protein COC50_25595 [Bacillus anthracis]
MKGRSGFLAFKLKKNIYQHSLIQLHLTLVKLSCMSVILYIHLIVKYAGMILNALMFTCFELKIRKFEMLVVYIMLNIVK